MHLNSWVPLCHIAILEVPILNNLAMPKWTNSGGGSDGRNWKRWNCKQSPIHPDRIIWEVIKVLEPRPNHQNDICWSWRIHPKDLRMSFKSLGPHYEQSRGFLSAKPKGIEDILEQAHRIPSNHVTTSLTAQREAYKIVFRLLESSWSKKMSEATKSNRGHWIGGVWKGVHHYTAIMERKTGINKYQAIATREISGMLLMRWYLTILTMGVLIPTSGLLWDVAFYRRPRRMPRVTKVQWSIQGKLLTQ